MRRCISIHAPREGGDSSSRHGSNSCFVFQSTPPARGATVLCQPVFVYWQISIHAPREGGDPAGAPPHPRRYISIHAPREGGDHSPSKVFANEIDFNPRPPRGGRRRRWDTWPVPPNFNPRPPRGGRRVEQPYHRHEQRISIHAPREGGDHADRWRPPRGNVFQSTPPARGATSCLAAARSVSLHFNPRPPRGGRHRF